MEEKMWNVPVTYSQAHHHELAAPSANCRSLMMTGRTMLHLASLLVVASPSLVLGEDGLPASDSGYPLHDAVYANDAEGMDQVLAQLDGVSDEQRQQALDEVDVRCSTSVLL
jgi:hypothetical protein